MKYKLLIVLLLCIVVSVDQTTTSESDIVKRLLQPDTVDIKSMCGNGKIEEQEECDDGNSEKEDGCNEKCQIEYSYFCTGQPSVCYSCGNGIIEGYEQCDDGNYYGGDGCDHRCRVEERYSCFKEPSICYFCGNGIIEGDEECDSGVEPLSLDEGDEEGCDQSCKVRPGFECEGQPSTCIFTFSSCGNGLIDDGEECDDGSYWDKDGCDVLCATEKGYTCAGEPSVCFMPCGNGIIGENEECDDGNEDPNDGCDRDCKIQLGYTCVGEPSVCVSPCGNGVIEGTEQCDDKNSRQYDGCDLLCQIEQGYVCKGSPSVCTETTCGNGVIEGNEQCDDGNTDSSDGCSSECLIDTNTFCTGSPSNCTGLCGDGKIGDKENCDDGNTANGDGCSSICQLEKSWQCLGSPSVCYFWGQYDNIVACGNGIIEENEQCDVGDNPNNDIVGCKNCLILPGFQCDGTPSVCKQPCGNLITTGDEKCDDGNELGGTLNTEIYYPFIGDGCSANCLKIERGYQCRKGGTECCPLYWGNHANECGDGVVECGEVCDPGYSENWDEWGENNGCWDNCTIVKGYHCYGGTPGFFGFSSICCPQGKFCYSNTYGLPIDIYYAFGLGHFVVLLLVFVCTPLQKCLFSIVFQGYFIGEVVSNFQKLLVVSFRGIDFTHLHHQHKCFIRWRMTLLHMVILVSMIYAFFVMVLSYWFQVWWCKVWFGLAVLYLLSKLSGSISSRESQAHYEPLKVIRNW